MKKFSTTKKVLITIGIVLFILFIAADRIYKSYDVYNYNEYTQEQELVIDKVDSLYQQTITKTKEVDYIKQTYNSKKDSLTKLKEISKHDKNKIAELDYQLKMLDQANALVEKEKGKIISKYNNKYDSLAKIIAFQQTELKYKDDIINTMEDKIYDLEMNIIEIDTKSMLFDTNHMDGNGDGSYDEDSYIEEIEQMSEDSTETKTKRGWFKKKDK